MAQPPSVPVARVLRVRGRVQGVGFRDACVDAARHAGLSGWVRNRRDGTVEVLVAGAPERVAGFEAWLRRGVPLARVDAIEAEPAEPPPGDAFERRPTT